ncbi:MAG: hypothetical protein M1821_007092 [Bathelium mastoideum]|nr:MAG: hypothetical protein M1821_007092 [Bathelium mastoideum]
MPSLNGITCQIELSGSDLPLREHQTSYGDGYVQTFVAVPSMRTGFSIHLTSQGYIAPGLGMFVFMDGLYQCNRYRHGLVVPSKDSPKHQTEVDLRVRQKEDSKGNGNFIGRDWTFEKLNTVSADQAPNTNPDVLGNIGTIEVVVLRCIEEGRPNQTLSPSEIKSATAVPPTKTTTKEKAIKTVSPKGKSDAASLVGSFAAFFDGSADDDYRRFDHYDEDWGDRNGGQRWYVPQSSHREPRLLSPFDPKRKVKRTQTPPHHEGLGIVMRRFLELPESGTDNSRTRDYENRERARYDFQPENRNDRQGAPQKGLESSRVLFRPDRRYLDGREHTGDAHAYSHANNRWTSVHGNSHGDPAYHLKNHHRDSGDWYGGGRKGDAYEEAPKRDQFRDEARDPGRRYGVEDHRRRGFGNPPRWPSLHRPEAFFRRGPHDLEATKELGRREHEQAGWGWQDTHPGPRKREPPGAYPQDEMRPASAGDDAQGQRRRSYHKRPSRRQSHSPPRRRGGDYGNNGYSRFDLHRDPGDDPRENFDRHGTRKSPHRSGSNNGGSPGYDRGHSRHHTWDGSREKPRNMGNEGGWSNGSRQGWDRGNDRSYNRGSRNGWDSNNQGDASHGNQGEWNYGDQGNDQGKWNNGNQKDWNQDGRGGWRSGGHGGWNGDNNAEWNNDNKGGGENGSCKQSKHTSPRGWNQGNEGGWNTNGPDQWNNNDSGGWHNSRRSRWNDGNRRGWNGDSPNQWNNNNQHWNNGENGHNQNWNRDENQSGRGDSSSDKKGKSMKSGQQMDDKKKKSSRKKHERNSMASSSAKQSSKSRSTRRSQGTSKNSKSRKSSRSHGSSTVRGSNNGGGWNAHNDQWINENGQWNNDNAGQWGANNNQQSGQWGNNNAGAGAQPPATPIGGPPERQIKPYWKSWGDESKQKSSNANRRARAELVFVEPEEPLHAIPQKTAQEKQVEHQVKMGRGATYYHRVGQPEYLDSMEAPFAVFSFKYRSKATLEQILGKSIPEDPEDCKRRMLAMSKNELVEELMRANGSNAPQDGNHTASGGQDQGKDAGGCNNNNDNGNGNSPKSNNAGGWNGGAAGSGVGWGNASNNGGWNGGGAGGWGNSSHNGGGRSNGGGGSAAGQQW